MVGNASGGGSYAEMESGCISGVIFLGTALVVVVTLVGLGVWKFLELAKISGVLP